MKKKIFSFLLAICMVIPMAFTLVACGDDDTSKGSEAGQTSTGTPATPAPETVTMTLGYYETTYNGEEQEPTIIVTKGDKIVSSDEYTVSYTNNTNAGTAKATITVKAKSTVLEAGSTMSKEFEIKRATHSVATISGLNEAIVNYADANHVIKLTQNLAMEKDATDKVVPIVIYPDGRNYDVAIDLSGYDINSYFRILSRRNTKDASTATEYVAKVNIFNSSKEESVVGTSDDSIDYALQVMSGNKFDINVENVKFQAYWGGLATSGNTWCTAETKISAKDCKFIATKVGAAGDPTDTGVGAYLPAGKYIYTFDTCEFTGFTGYYVKSGHHTLINCTVNGNGNEFFTPASFNGNGCNSTGSAIIIDSTQGGTYNTVPATGYQTAITVDIIGGTYTSNLGYGLEETMTIKTGYSGSYTCYATIIISDGATFVGGTEVDADYHVEHPSQVKGLN